jgi:basic membrane protein A
MTAAADHPDINFAVVDTELASPPPNLAGLTTADNEGAFLVGAAAGLRSTTHQIGFLGATQIDLIDNFAAGFVAGVEHVDPTALVSVDYIAAPGDFGGFTDPDRAYELATAMYASGIDVIFPPAGASTIGVTFAARDYTRATGDQVWMIGVDLDLYAQLTSWSGEYLTLRPHVLTSMVKRFDVIVHDTIVAQVNGVFEGGNHEFGLADNGVDYAVSGGFIDDLVPTLEQLRLDIIDGQILVPTYP